MTALLPAEARFDELIAPGIALYDVSHLLPKGTHRRATTRPKGVKIDAAFVHHSGALGLPGFEGLRRSVEFMVRRRDFPCSGYHGWAGRDPVRDPDGRLVVFRAVPDPVRAWHSGARANDRGLGFALQGNTSRLPLSPSQVEILEGLIPWLSEKHGWPTEDIAKWLGWHSIADRWGGRKKAACPGRDAERWLRAMVAQTTESRE